MMPIASLSSMLVSVSLQIECDSANTLAVASTARTTCRSFVDEFDTCGSVGVAVTVELAEVIESDFEVCVYDTTLIVPASCSNLEAGKKSIIVHHTAMPCYGYVELYVQVATGSGLICAVGVDLPSMELPECVNIEPVGDTISTEEPSAEMEFLADSSDSDALESVEPVEGTNHFRGHNDGGCGCNLSPSDEHVNGVFATLVLVFTALVVFGKTGAGSTEGHFARRSTTSVMKATVQSQRRIKPGNCHRE